MLRRVFLSAISLPFLPSLSMQRKGGQNPENDSLNRPPAPRGSGGDIDFKAARKRFCQEMADDPGLNSGYRANIACSIFDHWTRLDSGWLAQTRRALTLVECNVIAGHVMRRIFDLPEDIPYSKTDLLRVVAVNEWKQRQQCS